ncbi:MAG: AAA family ATPase [Endomicrobiia bacterium]|nr:MAG: AAA family ATPase [Endomicrobiia bacterium]
MKMLAIKEASRVKEIIAIVNQKGGSGKTTTVQALGVGLKKRGYKILFIDMDGQANLTELMQTDQNKNGLLYLLTKKIGIKEIVQKTISGADIIAGGEDSFEADIAVAGEGKEYRLKEALDEIKDEYDYIVIDTPPALSVLTVNALVASNSAIIASQAERLNLSGISRVEKIIETVRKYCNNGLIIRGILLTRFKERTRLNKETATVMESLAKKLNTIVYETTIRESVVISEAQMMQQSIFDYALKSNIAKDFEAFVEEFLRQGIEKGN